MMANDNIDVSALINDGQKDIVENGNSVNIKQVTASDYGNQEATSSFAFYGDAMNDDNVNELVDDIVPPVIVLVGFPQYGKSTFISSLYHIALCTGKVGKYKFLDSETLAGFERRSHIRNAEIAAKERLDRTPVYADYFLSMLFENTETGEHVKVVFSDRSGETYLKYAQQNGYLEKDKLLATDCHIIYFMDSEKIAADECFIELRDNIDHLTIRMKNKGLFDGNKSFEIVYNKADMLKEEDKQNEDFKYNIAQIEKKIERYCSLSKKTSISSMHPLENKELEKFFEEMIDGCACQVKLDEEVCNQLDWVHKIGG